LHRFDLITDKGTLDAVGLSDNAHANRLLYKQAVAKLVKPSGLLVITSCNSTLEELVHELCSPSDLQAHAGCHDDDGQRSGCLKAGNYEGGGRNLDVSPDSGRELGRCLQGNGSNSSVTNDSMRPLFEYVDHVRTYPVFRFGGMEGSKVCTVALRRL
jgi:hypothetical protein